MRNATTPDGQITPEFDAWLVQLDVELDDRGLGRWQFDAREIADEFEAGAHPAELAADLHAAKEA